MYRPKKTIRKKTYKRTYRPTNTKKLVSLIKSVNIRQSETKYKSGTIDLGAMYHNLIYQVHGWGPTGNSTNCLPGQGTADTNRVGDRIFLKGIMLRAIFQPVGDRRNTRIIAYWVPHNSESGSPSEDLFHNVTDNVLIDPVQKKRYPKAYKIGEFSTRPHDIEFLTSGTTTSANCPSIYIKKFIPINKKVFFKADASNVATNLHEYGTVCFCVYQNFNTLVTDQCVVGGSINMTAYFKDL
jgi:hypothetical protein